MGNGKKLPAARKGGQSTWHLTHCHDFSDCCAATGMKLGNLLELDVRRMLILLDRTIYK